MTLRGKAISAVRWTTMAGVVRALLNIAQVTVLARLLYPEDYGLMAIVTVVLSITSVFADLGINSAYMQKQEVSLEQRASLFWLNMLTSGCVMLVIMAGAPLLAAFFDEPRLQPLIVLSATIVVVNAVGQQVRIASEKALKFGPVILVEIFAAVSGFVSAVLAALAGWGVFALVTGSLATALVNSSLLWMFVTGGWRPRLRFSFNDVRPFLGFGGSIVANGLVRRVSANVDLLLGGRIFAATDLGFYSVPRNISLQVQFLVNPIITRVGFPLISRVQEDVPRVRSIYLSTLNMTASTNAPIYMGMAFFAQEVLYLLLGENWSGSVELFRILALWCLVRSTGNPLGSLLLGMGKAHWALWSNVILLFLQVPLLWYGALSGPSGLVWAMLTFQLLVFVPRWYLLVRPLTGAGLWEYSNAAMRPMLLSVLAICPVFLAVANLEGAVLRLLVGIGLAAPAYVLLSCAGNRSWVLEMLRLAGVRPQH